MLNLPFVLTILVLTGTAVRAAHWSYFGSLGPAEWASEYPSCGGASQSPIDINNAEYDDDLGEFELENFEDAMTSTEWSIENNGHSVQMTVEDGVYTTSGGGLPGSYNVEQFHFHWGSNDGQGSENHIDGRSFPMEMHIVHHNSQYNSVSDAQGHPDGLAVFSVLFEISDSDNQNLDKLIAAVQSVQEESVAYPVTPFALEDMMPDDLDDFYRFSGSLTTPSCDEGVIWTLFRDTVEISNSQMEAFRSLVADGAPLVDNFRPIQPLNGRTIYASFDVDE